MRVAPIGNADARALGVLACREDVLRFGDHAADASRTTWIDWLGPPDPDRGFTLGAFAGDRLEAALKVTTQHRRRRLHGASLHPIASAEPSGDEALDALLRAALDACDRWLQLVRCELVCAADHPRVEGLFAEHGFTPEARLQGSLRAAHGDALLDEVVLGRLRPGVQAPEPLPIARAIPPRGASSGRLRIRPAQPKDAESLATTLSEPIVMWGTLQLPFQRPERWSERLSAKPPARTTFLVAELESELVGSAALTVPHEERRAHTGTFGMNVATSAQGRGVGTALMRALLQDADRRSLTRVDLSVFPHNERARRLYERAGFVVEGKARWASFQDGTYADDLLMARVVHDAPRRT